MSDVERLLAAFDGGTLVRPDAGTANFVDLARALASTAGVPDLDLSPAAAGIAARLAGPEHVLFVLVDGLGMQQLEQLPADAWLRQHLVMPLQAVFPASTAVALTSLATGRWMTAHAVTSWWTHLPATGAAATILAFENRSDGKPLASYGVQPAEAFPVPSLMPQTRHAPLTLLPGDIADSVYSRYASGGAPREQYASLAATVEIVSERVRRSADATYTFLYIPHFDHLAHLFGADHIEAQRVMGEIDRTLAALAARLQDLAPGATRIAVAADHGHLRVTPGQRYLIGARDPLLRLLRCPPAGDSRVAFFHVEPGAREEFAAAFRARLGSHFVLLSADEVEELALFGPGPLSEETRRRIGDWMSLSLGAEVLAYNDGNSSRAMMNAASAHSGLTPAEMLIPLALA